MRLFIYCDSSDVVVVRAEDADDAKNLVEKHVGLGPGHALIELPPEGPRGVVHSFEIIRDGD